MLGSIKNWSKNVQIFSGNTNALLSNLPVKRNELFDLQVELLEELKDRTILYVQDIEEKYKKQDNDIDDGSPKKKRKLITPSASDYLKIVIVDSKMCDTIESPIARMTIYFAADVPWALDTSMSLDKFRDFVSELMLRSEKALVVNGDPMGIVAAQSASERFTQATLNSVDWETSMVVRWTSEQGPPPAPSDAEVGNFIDSLIAERPDDVQLQPDGVTVYLPLKKGEAEALSVTEDGKTVWTSLEAVTRHPPINNDGSNTLLNIKVQSGHDVIVTKGESMLVFRNNKIVPIRGDCVKIGDLVPVTGHLPSTRQEYLDLRSVFKKTDFVFTDEIIEAEKCWKSGDIKWYKNGNFKSRTPYSRSDAIRDAVQKKRKHLVKQPGMVGNKKACMRKVDNVETMLPQQLKLDRDFGFFVGAYLAEGCVSKFQIVIANNDTDFIKATRVWPDSLGITNHVKARNINNGISTCIRFPCRLLVQLMTAICGVGSYDKRVPAFAFTAPDEFVEGLLDAYISGDGRIHEKGIDISAGSRSKKMRDGISHLLVRFGITTRLSESHIPTKIKWLPDGSQERHGDKKPFYSFNTRTMGARIFANKISLTSSKKQAVLETYVNRPTNKKCRINIETLKDVQLQPVVSINEQPSSHPMVYDLTVASTRNMCTVSGIHLADTFHLAGTKKSAVTGIERINQLLNGTKSLDVPVLGPVIGDNCDMLVERNLEDYCYESGVVYKPTEDEKWSNFQIVLKLNNVSSWESIIKEHMPVSIKRDSIIKDDEVYIKFTSKNELSDIKATYAKLINTQVSGIKSCIEYDKEDKLLIFAPKTPLVKTRLVDKSMHSVIDNSTILKHCPNVDLTKMFSNDIYYIQTTFGIAAAESFIFEELKRTLGNEGININPAHISLMASNMTVSGCIMPNTFSGVNLEDSVILKATFQESTKTFANAAFNNFTDNIKDVSSQIMVGTQPRIGTQRVGCYYKEVGEIVERDRPDSPEYAPLSPEYAELPEDYGKDEYVPNSPVYMPASPVYFVDGEFPEPEIDI
jgi:DNA-directed RNA polymerase subunit A"